MAKKKKTKQNPTIIRIILRIQIAFAYHDQEEDHAQQREPTCVAKVACER